MRYCCIFVLVSAQLAGDETIFVPQSIVVEIVVKASFLMCLYSVCFLNFKLAMAGVAGVPPPALQIHKLCT